jgi:hypothetical protein
MDYDPLIELLRAYSGQHAFNHYRDEDPALDLPGGADVRCRNLGTYLDAFRAGRFLLGGEGTACAGCRFSGIRVTCEVQLVGAAPLPGPPDAA